MLLEVSLTPALYPFRTIKKNHVTVAIDVLRATTAVCAAFQAGCSEVVPLDSLDDLVDYHHRGYSLAAERGGSKVDIALPDGGTVVAEYGNSPTEYLRHDLSGVRLAYSTTNGTRTILRAADADSTLVGAFANLDALCDHLQAFTVPSLREDHLQALTVPSLREDHLQALTVPSLREDHLQAFTVPSLREDHLQALTVPSLREDHLQALTVPSLREGCRGGGLDIVILCSGWQNDFCLEDTLVAGAIIEKLSIFNSQFSIFGDAAHMALTLWQLAKDDPRAYCEQASHVHRLRRLGAQADIDFAFQLNTCPVVPTLKQGILVKK